MRPQFRYTLPLQEMMPTSDRLGLAPSFVHDAGGGSGVQVAYYSSGMTQSTRYHNPTNAAAYGGYVSPVSCLLSY